jgi:hypothetical protein
LWNLILAGLKLEARCPVVSGKSSELELEEERAFTSLQRYRGRQTYRLNIGIFSLDLKLIQGSPTNTL